MIAVRRTALTLALALAATLGSAGAGAPAQATFADSHAVSTAISTATVAAPGNVVGTLTCRRNSATMSATWDLSTSARVSGYTVTTYSSDGYVQTWELGPSVTSWESTVDPYYVTAFSVQYSVTTRTNYGWFTESARTGTFQC